MSEQTIQKSGINFIESAGGYCTKIIQANKAGAPDTINCIPVTITQEMVGHRIGLYFAIEYKTQEGRISKIQEHNIKKIKECGGIAIVARSLDDVKDGIKSLDNIP